MKTTERIVHFYELTIRSHTRAEGIKNPSCASLAQILNAIETLGPAGRTPYKRKNVMIDLADWKQGRTSKDTFILINRADKSASDVAFKDFGTRKIRKGNKTLDEGIDCSSHVLIRPEANEPKALLLMTMGAGITSPLVATILNMLVRELQEKPAHSKLFKFRHPSGAVMSDGEPETYKVRYRFDCSAYKSTVLDDALANGAFVGMELIAHQYSAFDSGGNFKIERQEIAVKAAVPQTVTGAAVRNAIQAFCKKPNQYQFDHLRIRYKHGGKDAITTLDVNHLDAAFTRKQTIFLDTPEEQQQLTLSKQIINKMKATI